MKMKWYSISHMEERIRIRRVTAGLIVTRVPRGPSATCASLFYLLRLGICRTKENAAELSSVIPVGAESILEVKAFYNSPRSGPVVSTEYALCAQQRW